MIFTSLFLVLFLIWVYKSSVKIKNFPPGPPKLPILGGIPWIVQGTKGNAIQSLQKLHNNYGKVTGFYIANSKFIVISDVELVKEAFKNEHLADRPDMKPFNKFRLGHDFPTLTGAPGLALSGGSYWQEQRRFTLRNLRDLGFGRVSMEELFHIEANKLCQLLQSKESQDLNLNIIL